MWKPSVMVTGSIPVGTTRAANTRAALHCKKKFGTKPAQKISRGEIAESGRACARAFFPVLEWMGKKKKCLNLTR